MKPFFRKLRWLLRRSEKEEDLQEEVRFHLEAVVEDLIESGLSAEEARSQALREFGNTLLVKEEARAAWGWTLVEQLVQDLRFAVRTLGKNPGFSVIAILSLALGIGGSTAMFSVADAALLRPLPYPEPDRLVTFTTRTSQGEFLNAISGPTYEFWLENSSSFEAFSAVGFDGANLTGETESRRVDRHRVTSNFFQAIGVQPVLGRGFLPEDDDPGAAPVLIMSHPVWQDLFGGRPEVLGEPMSMNDISHTIVGILPPGFTYAGSATAIYTPLELSSDPLYAGHNYTVLARLQSNISIELAEADMARLFPSFTEANPAVTRELQGFGLITLRDAYNAQAGPLFVVLLGTIGVVLLIACANVASLLVSRATSRQREIVTRLAIGAGPGRIFRQLATEGIVLSGLAALAGTFLAYWGIRVLVSSSPLLGILAPSASIDIRVLAFALVVSVTIGVVFGLVSIVHTRRTDSQSALKETGAIGQTGNRARLANVLVTLEVALALTLLIGASLLTVTFYRLHSIPLGFNDTNLTAVELSLASERYATARAVDLFEQSLRERVQAIPGVVSVATASGAPLVRTLNTIAVIEGLPDQDRILVEYRSVSPEYFQTLEIPVLRGRGIEATDTRNALPIVLINETETSRFPDGIDPLGAQLILSRGLPHEDRTRQVVGIVGDVSDRPPGAPIEATVYVPRSQAGDALNNLGNELFSSAVLIRTTGSVSLTETFRETVSEIDPQVPVTNIRTVDEIASDATEQERFNMLLTLMFAGLALILTVVGLYGVLTYHVVQRTQEIGIRSALGAQRFQLVGIVLRRGMALALFGLALGLAGSVILTRFLSSVLFGVTALDFPIYAVVCVSLAVIAFLASYVPACRASRVDPLVAFRYE